MDQQLQEQCSPERGFDTWYRRGVQAAQWVVAGVGEGSFLTALSSQYLGGALLSPAIWIVIWMLVPYAMLRRALRSDRPRPRRP